jgi:hypothetical protein
LADIEKAALCADICGARLCALAAPWHMQARIKLEYAESSSRAQTRPSLVKTPFCMIRLLQPEQQNEESILPEGEAS